MSHLRKYPALTCSKEKISILKMEKLKFNKIPSEEIWKFSIEILSSWNMLGEAGKNGLPCSKFIPCKIYST